ncbi:Stealth CR1 domain-containing protein [Legionella brunensis]|uniref:Capsular polysaccharide phosphotransferase cps12A n=1 Tax=Legionella brunensis TaxID=29422 RepID=A0A0W0SUW1_9GAMM|nr:Stealth CR1 domain-containing protein [Legionella brunensis]KTC87068.1 Capsular polysaccharide phosphotransferase cps12A [Legionella brunensis]
MDPIDAVISWVDGYDPDYQQKLKSYCLQLGIEQNIAVEPTRIQQCNEIHFCLQALHRFAPWIRTIYIITNQQTPPAVTALQGTTFGNKIKIIDQNELLLEFNSTTPVFNSLSIEWLIWKIKGLSNQFLYLNDDFFIIRNVTPDDFFRNNRMVLRGEWKVQTEQKWRHKIKKNLLGLIGRKAEKPQNNPHRSWQENSASLAGLNKKFYLLPHAPFPLIKETFNDYVIDRPELFTENIRFPFRHPDQVSSIPLMVHLDIKNNRALYDSNHQAIMVNGASHSFKKIKSRLNLAKKSEHVTFICMQSIDQASPEVREYMVNWLQQNIAN